MIQMLVNCKLFLQSRKKLIDVVDKEVVKNTKFSTLKTKVNNLEKKISDSATLIHINQYNTDKTKFREKQLEMVIEKYQMQVLQQLHTF